MWFKYVKLSILFLDYFIDIYYLDEPARTSVPVPIAAASTGSRSRAAQSFQQGMSEDEALAAALAASMADVPAPRPAFSAPTGLSQVRSMYHWAKSILIEYLFKICICVN